MAIAYVQKATQSIQDAQSGTVSISLTGVTTGSALVFTASIFNVATGFTISGVSDGNAYTVRSSVITTGGARQYQVVAYLLNASSGSHTVTATLSGATASNTYAVLGLSEFSGIATSSAEDTWDENSTTNANTVDISAGPITTTEAGDLLVGCAGFIQASAGTVSWGSPASWTNLYRNDDGYTTGTCHDAAYWLPGSTQSSYSPQWSHTNNIVDSDMAAALVVALKPAAGGGSIVPQAMAQYINQVIS